MTRGHEISTGRFLVLFLFMVPLALTAWASCKATSASDRVPGTDVAHAQLAPTKGYEAQGVIHLQRAGDRIHITGKVTGLAPGQHGFHIHEHGDCGGVGAKAAGEHFAPEGHPHGDPAAGVSQHHAGDLGNIVADNGGVATVDAWTSLPLLTKGRDNAVGKAFIVHEGKDDLHSQPAGAAGPRVACGVIKTGDGGG